ncbi:hypothetical protein Y032_0023g719 [Ancylostoma ceylanicum]|uniref:Uncharacterized protein n=1 Tax=Ancylostoma ceylanicum TaxID=53326 RepID=A0A016UWH4_9BILA|nr:hypothetical protein Y032_0023g719 [Ancylostoma ceylanicum]
MRDHRNGIASSNTQLTADDVTGHQNPHAAVLAVLLNSIPEVSEGGTDSVGWTPYPILCPPQRAPYRKVLRRASFRWVALKFE